MDAEGYGNLQVCLTAAKDMYPFFIYMFSKKGQGKKEKGVKSGNII